MFKLVAARNKLTVDGFELITSGSLNVNYLQFAMSSEWETLTKIVCFRVEGNIPVGNTCSNGFTSAADVYLPEDGIIALPYALSVYPGTTIQVGLYGVDPVTKEVILPTIWAELGEVQQGVQLSNMETPNPPDISLPEGGGVSEAQVVNIIKKYNQQHPVQWTEIKGVPEPLTNVQLEEILK